MNDDPLKKGFENLSRINTFYFLDIARGMLPEGYNWKDIENNEELKSEIEEKFEHFLPTIKKVRDSTGIELR